MIVLACATPRRHSLEEGKKLREQDPNITQIKGPDEETITPGNWPKTGTPTTARPTQKRV